MSCSSSTVDSAKMLRMSSSTISTFLPASDLVGLVQLLERAALALGQLADVAVQEERRLVEQPLERARLAQRDSARASAATPASRRVVAVAVHDHRQLATPRRRSSVVEHVLGAEVGDRRGRRPRSRRCRRAAARAPASASSATATSTSPSQALDAARPRRRRSGSTTSSRLRGRVDEARAAASSASSTHVAGSAAAWRRSRSRPARSARSRASSVEITQTGMWRVARSFFSRSSTRQPSMSGRKMSSVIADGLVLARQRQRGGAAAR